MTTRKPATALPWTEKAKASFWSKVDQSGGPDACWPWTLSRVGTGYGQVNMGKSHGPAQRAHRVAFQLAKGPIPEGPKNGAQGIAVLHSCDNRLCCNPKHLRVGTQLENIQDAFKKGRMKAPQANDAEVKRRAAAYPRLVGMLKAIDRGIAKCAEAETITAREIMQTETYRLIGALLRDLGEQS